MLEQLSHTTRDFERDGYALLPSIVPGAELDRLTDAIEESRQSQLLPGLRNLLSRCEVVRSFADSGIVNSIARALLKTDVRPVRAILFDKTPDSNWYVTWHQDLTIPVKARIDIDGYGPWSVKEGVVHVRPPASILAQMVSLRIHLDDCTEENGAIKFIASSQDAGILEADDIAYWRGSHVQTVCPAGRGDIIAMRPLILHSSSVSESPVHRRVLHIEYAGAVLPASLEWAEA